MLPIRIKACSESDLRMLGDLARNIQRVLPVTQADIDAAAALGKGWVVWKVIEVNDPIDNLRGGTQLVIKQNSILPGQNVRRVLIVSGPGGQMVVVGPDESPLLLPDAIADSLSYVKAFGGTEQRNLPDGYIERQFIYMMDGSYLLTDIVPTYDGRIEMDFQTTSILGNAETYLSAGSSNFRFAHVSAKTFRVNMWGGTYDSTTTTTNNTRYKFTYNNLVATLESGGSTVFTNTFTDTGTTSSHLIINGLSSSGGVSQNDEGIYLYSFKVWNAQGELVADYVPAVQKGTVPVVGFYDTVSGTFKTATAGTFAAGGEAVPTPDAPMDIVSNNGVLKARHQSGLPLGYTQVESLTSAAGTGAYINTGVKAASTVKIEIVVDRPEPPATGTSWYAFGALNNATNGQLACFESTNSVPQPYIALTYGKVAYSEVVGEATGMAKSTLVLDGGILTYDNGTKTVTSPQAGQTFTTTNDIWLCARENVSASSLDSVTIYSAKFWDNGVLVRDLICVKRASDNQLGMYDLVNDTFIECQGTFTAGATVSDPVEIYTDGTVETINVHNKNLFDAQNVEIEESTAISSNGSLVTHLGVDTCASYIKVLPNTTYTISGDKLGNPSGDGGFVYYFRLATYDGNKQFLARSTDSETVTNEYTFTTGANVEYIRFHYVKTGNINTFQLEKGATATTYEPYFDGGTATAEMLLKVGDYKDVQSIIDGAVTRKVGIKVLDGTETGWTKLSGANYVSLPKTAISNMASGTDATCLSNNFVQVPHSSVSLSEECFTVGASYVNFKKAGDPTVAQFKSWLANQYANGTPVTIVYPLATSTTESVAGQTLQVQAGDNIVEITQASMNNLQLECEYEKTV